MTIPCQNVERFLVGAILMWKPISSDFIYLEGKFRLLLYKYIEFGTSIYVVVLWEISEDTVTDFGPLRDLCSSSVAPCILPECPDETD